MDSGAGALAAAPARAACEFLKTMAPTEFQFPARLRSATGGVLEDKRTLRGYCKLGGAEDLWVANSSVKVFSDGFYVRI